MTEYKVWAFARSAAPNLPALEDQLADVMREADRRGYIIVNSCMEQKYGTEFWRPALFAMLTAVQQGRVNAVMVQSLDRLSHDITTLYRILRFLQNHGAILITTKTNLQYELYLTGLENRLLNRTRQRNLYGYVRTVRMENAETKRGKNGVQSIVVRCGEYTANLAFREKCDTDVMIPIKELIMSAYDLRKQLEEQDNR